MIALIAIIGAGIGLALGFIRLFAGPTLYDRVLAVNGVVLKLAIVLAGAAVLAGGAGWVDVALALLGVSLVVNVAVLKFFRVRTFQTPLSRAEEI